jgi:hypothetical protein
MDSSLEPNPNINKFAAPMPPSPTNPANPIQNNQKSKTPKSKGVFIIIVIVFLIVLGWWIVSNVSRAKALSRDAQRRADIGQLQSGLYLYHHDQGRYPDSLLELQPKYITVLPIAPTPPDGPCTDTQNSYSYTKNGPDSYGLSYCLGSGAQIKNGLTGQVTTISEGIQTIEVNSTTSN